MELDWPPALNPVMVGMVALLGACVGSFITMITYRLPRGEAVGMTRSRCPGCGTTLAVRDLFPVASWMLSAGKCRHCKVPVSMRYPLTELASALGAVLAVAGYGLSLEAVALAGLWWCIVTIIITDLEHYIILDEVQITAVLLGVLYTYATDTPWSHALGGAVAGAAIGFTLRYGFLYLRKKDGLGMGDVKFLGVAGIWLASAANFVPFLFFSGVMGIASGVVWRLLKRGEQFPFGPALALSLLLCVAMPEVANGFWQLYGLLPYAGPSLLLDSGR